MSCKQMNESNIRHGGNRALRRANYKELGENINLFPEIILQNNGFTEH